MNHLVLPSQVILRLTWSHLHSLFQVLQQTYDNESKQPVVITWGPSRSLCYELHKLWQQSLHSYSTITAAAQAQLKSRLKVKHTAGSTALRANLLVLSSSLKVCIQIEPIDIPDIQTDLAQRNFQWKTNYPLHVSLNFEHSAIADLLKASVFASLTDYTTQTEQQSEALQKFWLQLLQLPQTSPPLPPNPLEVSPDLEALLPMGTKDSLSQHIPIGILYTGLDGGITKANPEFCRLLGYTEAQLRQLDNQFITHPEDFAVELRTIQWMIAQGQEQHFLQKRYQRFDGSVIWTQVKLSFIEDAATGEPIILNFVTDVSERKLAEQEIHQRREREALLNEISAQLRSTYDLKTILNVAVQRLRQALDTDRVLAYQFLSDQSGICLAEDVAAAYLPMLQQSFPPECIPPPHLEAYREGRFWCVPNVQDVELAECHQTMLKQVCVCSMIATAIVIMDASLELQKRTLWGLLVVHHCRAPREWTADEQQLVQAVANQIATALEQNKLLHQLQRQTQELEDRVSQRTRSLEQALKFERLTHRLTEVLRTTLDETQVLKTAVEGLVQTLGVDGCISSLFDAQREELEIRCEFFQAKVTQPRSLIGHRFPLTCWPETCRRNLLHKKTYFGQLSHDQVQQSIDPILDRFNLSTAEPHAAGVSGMMSPITDDQGLIGALTVFYLQPREFEPEETALIEQVANQCAIALRQAHLYRQEHELRLSADYFRSFLEKSTDVFVEYDPELRYISINPAGSAYLTLPAHEIIGKTNRELLGDEAESFEPLIRHVFDTGEKMFINHEVESPQGTKIFETIYAPITLPSGVVQRVIGVCRDVTELKQQWQLLEQQNHQLAETTRLKEEFIATTSHELRTPLTAILGFSNVLLQEFFGELNSKQKDYIERIHNSGQHLLDLINDILDLSRLEAERLELDLQAVFLPDICEGVMALIQERANYQGLTLELELDPTVEWMLVDPRRLKQMLLNLLTNAVKFTTEGAVGLKVHRHSSLNQSVLKTLIPVDQATIDSAANTTITDNISSDVVYFQVWDTGIGIAETDQQRLFSPFSQIDSSLTRQHQGTGLGLVITRKLAELHGGTVTLESRPNQGTRFTIVLPLRSPTHFYPTVTTVRHE